MPLSPRSLDFLSFSIRKELKRFFGIDIVSCVPEFVRDTRGIGDGCGKGW